MNSLIYILVRSAKNNLRELIRKPGKLILYIIAIAGIAFMLIGQLFSNIEREEYLDIVWLKGIAFGIFLLLFVMTLLQGLSKGSAIFGMEDVNLLFVSPVNPRAILIYGISRMMKTALLSGIFILVQGINLERMFGISFDAMFVIFAGYILLLLVSQILSLFIYGATNGNPRRQLCVKIIMVLIFAPMAMVAIQKLQSVNWDIMASLPELLRSPATSFTPVVGWASAGITAFITGDYAMGTLFFGLIAALGAGLVVTIFVSRPDYYEDVLVASETAFETKRKISEGKVMSLEAVSGKRVRIKGTGISGFGASALFGKHVRESFRANRFGLWGISTIVITISAALYTFIVKNSIPAGFTLMTVLIFFMYIQLFFIGMGRGLKETYAHYIYMLPASPFSKMIWGNMEVMLKTGVESALIFGVSGLIARENPLIILMAAVTYTAYSFLLVAINYVSLRVTGADMSAGLLIMLYMIMVLIILLPGIAGAVVSVIFIEGTAGILTGLVALSLWELLAAFACLALARGILHNCDMAVLKQTTLTK